MRRFLASCKSASVLAVGKHKAKGAGVKDTNTTRVSKPKIKMAGPGLRVAIEGCCHGELDKIYQTLQMLERKDNKKIDLLICCGDFQAVRNLNDLECLACPPKYRALNTFYKYYTGEKKAPYPTLFIGGNHEAVNHLWELYYGGWAAPDIYYLGHAGVVNFGGVRIGGMSGTHSSAHYQWGHFERPPYNPNSMRSAYHLRELEVFRLRQLQRPLDVMLSHDWPSRIAFHGDKENLFRRKPFLKTEISDGRLGSAPARELMDLLQPRYWFSAHMHVKFSALVRHGPPAQDGPFTRFLALDKCLPRRDFLQVIDFPEARGPKEFSYDEEWLAILRGTHDLLSLRKVPRPLPGMGAARKGASEADLAAVRSALGARGSPAVPRNFVQTAPGHGKPGAPVGRRDVRMPDRALRNPQTVAFLEMLGLPYNLDQEAPPAAGLAEGIAAAAAEESNPEEIDIGDDEGDEEVLQDESAVADQDEDSMQDDPMFSAVEIHNLPSSADVTAPSEPALGAHMQRRGALSAALAAITPVGADGVSNAEELALPDEEDEETAEAMT